MATRSTAARGTESPVSFPSHRVGYLAPLAAVVTAIVHLVLGTRVMGFSQTLGVLLLLNGLGYFGWIGLYLSQYWRRESHLVVAGYGLVTILAFFAFQRFSLEAFYPRGSLNPLAVGAKGTELVLVVCTLFPYSRESVDR